MSRYAEIKAKQARDREERNRVFLHGSEEEKRRLRERNHRMLAGVIFRWYPGIERDLDVKL